MNNGVGREHQECIVGIDIGSSATSRTMGCWMLLELKFRA